MASKTQRTIQERLASLTTHEARSVSMTQMTTEEAEKVSAAFDFLREATGKPIAVDTETNAEDVRDGRGFAMGVSIAYRRADGSYDSKYFPFRHRGSGDLPSEVLDALRTVVGSAPS